MVNIIRLKYRMRLYARTHGLEIPPGFSVPTPLWGEPAKTLAWRVSTHLSEHGRDIEPTTSATVLNKYFYPPAPALKILDAGLKFRPLTERVGAPKRIVWHNSGSSTGTVEAFHAYHLSLGWAGIGYHYVVYKDGRVFKGRPDWAMGGHCYKHNDTIGVCFVGNYESSDRFMPTAQLISGKLLHALLHKKYVGVGDTRHGDMPDNSTACPGRYFPFLALTS